MTTSKTSIPELSYEEMLALTRRASLKFKVATDADDHGDVVAQVMFVVGDSGPLGNTPVEPQRDLMVAAALVEQHCEQYAL